MYKMMFENISGIIFDFDGVFTDNYVYTTSDGVESVRCSKYDSFALSSFRASYPLVHMVVISSESNHSILHRCNKLRLEVLQDVDDKYDAAQKWSSIKNISLDNCAFLANDLNDLQLCKSVGFPFAVADCNPLLHPFVIGKTSSPGGQGAIKDFLEIILSGNATKPFRFTPIRKLSHKSVGSRDWGTEDLLASLDGCFTFKKLVLHQNASGGLQFHRLKNEFVFVMAGKLLVKHDDGSGKLIDSIFVPGDMLHFPPGSVHQEIALQECILLEVSTPHFNDRVRVEHLYKMSMSDTNSNLPSTSLIDIRSSL